jgi:hypothetical protein
MNLAKLASLALLALLSFGTSASAEQPVKKPPPPAPAVKETAAEKAGRAFLKTTVETADAVGIPKAGIQYFFDLPDGTKGCEGMTSGNSNSAATAAKLKTCVAAAYRTIGQGAAVAKIGLAEVELDKFVGHFPKADQKKMKDLTVGTKVVEANLSGDGESLRISISVHPTNGVVAVWLDAEAVE